MPEDVYNPNSRHGTAACSSSSYLYSFCFSEKEQNIVFVTVYIISFIDGSGKRKPSEGLCLFEEEEDLTKGKKLNHDSYYRILEFLLYKSILDQQYFRWHTFSMINIIHISICFSMFLSCCKFYVFIFYFLEHPAQ